MVDPASSSSRSSGSFVNDEQLVKGLAFETIRLYIKDEHGGESWAELMAALPPRTSKLFEGAEIGEWYPETDMRRGIHKIYELLAHEDDEVFLTIMRGVALKGINRFFRMVLTLATGRFVLVHIGTLWRRIRRGPAMLKTEIAEDGRVLVHYEFYRYCRDPVYRLISISNCQALVFAATGHVPKAEVLEWDKYTMTLAFELADGKR